MYEQDATHHGDEVRVLREVRGPGGPVTRVPGARHPGEYLVDRLGMLAKASRQVRERCGDIVTILASGAAVDPDIAVALLSAGVHDSLVADAGWSYDDYEAWLKQTLAAAVLGE
ncbi:hypothetical protein ACWELB_02995 [Streptomyces asiaticus]